MPKVKISRYFFPVIFLFISLIYVQTVGATPPECTEENRGDTITAFVGDSRSQDECPAETFCYSVDRSGRPAVWSCHKEKVAPPPVEPPPTEPPSDRTDPITISPNPAAVNQPINIRLNYVEGFGNYLLSTSVPNQLEPSPLKFSVSASGCRKISGNIRYTSITCSIVDDSKSAWAANIVYNLTYSSNSSGYEVALFGESGNTTGIVAKERFCVGSCTSGKLSVSVSPSGPFNNDVTTDLTISWSPALNGTSYFITSTGDLFTPKNKRCDSSPCSITVKIPDPANPASKSPGVKQITVTQDGDSSNFGNKEVEIKGIASPINPIPTPKQCKDKNDPDVLAGIAPACSSAVGVKCDDGKGILTAIGCVPTEPESFIQGAIRFIMLAAGGIAFLLMIFGAIQMLTSAGNPETLKKGQEQFTSAILGLLFIIFSTLLLQIIGVDILGIPGFTR